VHRYIVLASVLFLLFTCRAVFACSCAEPGPPCNYYGEAAVIFLGRVVGSAERRTYVDEKGNKIVYDVGTIRFLVQENYKGATGYEVVIHSGTGGGDCGYWFLRNESYVVYAYGDPQTGLSTNICTRTSHVSQASEDLEYLRGLSKAKPGATLYGQLTRIIGDSNHGPYEEGPKMAGVKIHVSGAGQTLETTTNDAGEFRVTGLPPGDYDAFPELPVNLAAISDHDERDNFGRFTGRTPVRLTDRGCGSFGFYVQFSGVISGTVLDAKGEPAKEVQVNLISGDDDDKDWWTWTDKEGHYEFRMVQPGSYLLGFNLRWAPDKDDPYPKTFYPNVKTRTEASLITMGEGEKLKGYDMTLPSRLNERQLKVTVVWLDGRPAVGVDVDFEMNEATTLGERIKTDEKGTAILKLFEGHYYLIYANAERNNKDIHSTPIEVFVNSNLKPVKLVLAKDGYGYEDQRKFKRKPPE
jgi:5-hydroxyisourate hydrolase-like protein (transthyretin family)